MFFNKYYYGFGNRFTGPLVFIWDVGKSEDKLQDK